MDGRKNNGGARKGAGRKPKAEEQKLIDKLSPLEEIAFKKLKEGLNEGDYRYVKMYFEYRFGKPKESKEIDLKASHQFADWPDDRINAEIERLKDI